MKSRKKRHQSFAIGGWSMKRIQHYAKPGLSNEDLKGYLKESHRIVALGLSKKRRQELGLSEG